MVIEIVFVAAAGARIARALGVTPGASGSAPGIASLPRGWPLQPAAKANAATAMAKIERGELFCTLIVPW